MNRLNYFRERASLTQTELAERSGVEQPDISKAEKGIKDLKGLSWASIARVLRCSVDELLGSGVRDEGK